MSQLTWLEAGVVGAFQGVSELFPVSSLGHSVLIPALVGGSWARDLNVSAPESPYLAFIVGLHVATAIALIVYLWRDWVRIIRGLLTSIRDRSVTTPDQRLAWLLVLATIPVGLIGLIFEHTFRVRFGKPLPAALFLTLNGFLLLGGEWLRRRTAQRDVGADDGGDDAARALASDRRLAGVGLGNALIIGTAEIGALFSGISRSGSAMVAGLVRGLSNEDAARFSFLLATPVILAAGALKVPDLTGPLGNGIRGQVVFGSVISGVGAYLAVRFLDRYFRSRTLTPFGLYCIAAGAFCSIRFGLF